MFKSLFSNTKALEKRIKELEKRIASLEKKDKKSGSTEKSTKSSKTSKKEKQALKEAKYQKKVENAITTVMDITGWSREVVEKKFNEAHENIHCTPKEFVMYKFYEVSPEDQKTYYVAWYQKFLQKKYGVDKEFVELLYDKERTNLYFSEYVRRPWCVNTKVTKEEFAKIFENTSRIMYKPNDGHRGYGIEAFYINEDNIGEVYDKLATYPKGVVEEFIVQHPDMASLSPSSVNSLRFVTVSSNTTPVTPDGKMMDVAYAIVRIGRGESIVDNLHSGGMVANVDLETGKFMTRGADRNGKMYETHPETGVVIKGFQVPFFKEAYEMVLEAIETKKVEGYLGWDIAISENGPMLLEVNDRPGSDGLQTAPAQDKMGMFYVMEKYL